MSKWREFWLKRHIDVFFIVARVIRMFGGWTEDRQNVMDDLESVPNCTESCAAVRECIGRLVLGK